MELKFGIISEIDIESGLARVYFEEDDFVSAPLKISVMRSYGDQIFFPFVVNEHVYCVLDDNWEYGVIAGAIYDEKNKPAGSAKGKFLLKFNDSSTIEYDQESATLTLDIKGTVNIKCSDSNVECSGKATVKADEVEIEAAKTDIKGILNVSGAANIQGVASVGGLAGISGGAVEAGDSEIKVEKLTATNDVTAGTVSLKTHRHTSSGSGSPTSAPIP